MQKREHSILGTKTIYSPMYPPSLSFYIYLSICIPYGNSCICSQRSQAHPVYSIPSSYSKNKILLLFFHLGVETLINFNLNRIGPQKFIINKPKTKCLKMRFIIRFKIMTSKIVFIVACFFKWLKVSGIVPFMATYLKGWFSYFSQ